MLKNNNSIKILSLLCFLFFFLSCKNENTKTQNQTSVEDTVKVNDNTNISETSKNNENSINKPVKDTLSLIKEQREKIKREFKLDSTKQYVYLTFDDGPFKGSKNINKILTEEKTRGTVFVVGTNAFTKHLKELIEEYKLNPNIDIANHTFSHANNKYKLFYSNPEGVYNDILKNEKFFDIQTPLVRLPARNVWRLNNRKRGDFLKDANAAGDIIAKNNYYIYGWDYEWSRNKVKLEDPQKIYEGIVHRLDRNLTFEKNHLVILMHDDMFNSDQNAEKLRQLIILLKNNPKIVIEGISNYPIRPAVS